MTSHPSARIVEGILENRLPQTDLLVGDSLVIAHDGGMLRLVFDEERVRWRLPDGAEGEDPYDAVELSPGRLFVDIWLRSADDRRSVTLLLDTDTGHAIDVVTQAIRAGAATRFEHHFTRGVLRRPSGAVRRAVPGTGSEPAPTRDLVGRRVLSVYSPDLVFEQIYLNSHSVAWQCLRGWQPGAGDVDGATYWKLGDSLYVFGLREAVAQSSSVFALDFERGRATGKFHGVEDDGTLVNGALGARLDPLSTAVYPAGLEPA